mmetsp:Transcript_93231/g.240948  ORF Transcript_93231/g.240948 Transcript_93231/m.240948 type:complete len:183 (-) Transcript_93231:91-639(-)
MADRGFGLSSADSRRPLHSHAQYLQGVHHHAVHSSTALGDCRLDTAGHLVPCDDRHAPVKAYRSYGEWWEAGQKAPPKDMLPHTSTSRFWPYGQDVTKLYQTSDKKHKYKLDDRCVEGSKAYVPPRNGSLPDLRAYRNQAPHQGGSRHADHIDSSYHRDFHANDPKASYVLQLERDRSGPPR